MQVLLGEHEDNLNNYTAFIREIRMFLTFPRLSYIQAHQVLLAR